MAGVGNERNMAHKMLQALFSHIPNKFKYLQGPLACIYMTYSSCLLGFLLNRQLENMVQYQYSWGPFFNYQKLPKIHLYNIGNEFIYIYLVKILQNK